MTKAKELREQTDDQLQVLIEDIDKEIFEMRNEFAVNRKLDKPYLISEKKRDKARALTILSQRKKIVEEKGNQ